MPVRLLTRLIALLGLSSSVAFAEPPVERVVSLDYCADQFVLQLLPRESILALSPDATSDFSYLRDKAEGLPVVRSTAEDVLSIEPAVVVRSYGGGPKAAQFFERAGVRVIQVPFGNDIAGIRTTIDHLANELGVPDTGQALIAEMDLRLERIQTDGKRRKALYMTPTGVTSGPGTLVHEMLTAAGVDNFQERAGWRSLPLERLAYESPDVVVAAFFDASQDHPGMWSAMRHPIARKQIGERPTASIQGAWTACGAWFLLDAIEAIAAVAQ